MGAELTLTRSALSVPLASAVACIAFLYLESLTLDADRAASERTDVLAPIRTELGRRQHPCIVFTVNLLDPLPRIDGHIDQANDSFEFGLLLAAGVWLCSRVLTRIRVQGACQLSLTTHWTHRATRAVPFRVPFHRCA